MFQPFPLAVRDFVNKEKCKRKQQYVYKLREEALDEVLYEETVEMLGKIFKVELQRAGCYKITKDHSNSNFYHCNREIVSHPEIGLDFILIDFI